MSEPQPLDYASPPTADQPPLQSARGGFWPWLGLLAAVMSLAVAQLIWVTGPFGNARRDGTAMIIALLAGAALALTGCVAGVRQHDRADGPAWTQGAGFLFGVLNLAAACLLLYGAANVYRRMY